MPMRHLLIMLNSRFAIWLYYPMTVDHNSESHGGATVLRSAVDMLVIC